MNTLSNLVRRTRRWLEIHITRKFPTELLTRPGPVYSRFAAFDVGDELDREVGNYRTVATNNQVKFASVRT
jgi:hypothetical protein